MREPLIKTCQKKSHQYKDNSLCMYTHIEVELMGKIFHHLQHATCLLFLLYSVYHWGCHLETTKKHSYTNHLDTNNKTGPAKYKPTRLINDGSYLSAHTNSDKFKYFTDVQVFEISLKDYPDNSGSLIKWALNSHLVEQVCHPERWAAVRDEAAEGHGVKNSQSKFILHHTTVTKKVGLKGNSQR